MQEGWPTLKLAAPIMLARTGVTLMFVVDSIILGQAFGRDLAAYGQALAPQSVMMLICIGLMQGSLILSSQAYGAGDFTECGRVWKTALIIGFCAGGAVALLSLFVGPFLAFTGTERGLAEKAGGLSIHFAWGMQGMLLFITSNYFLESVKRPGFGVAIMAIVNAVNLLADGILVGGWFGLAQGHGSETVVITTSAVRWLAFAIALSLILSLPNFSRYAIAEKLGPFWPRAVKLLRLSAPIALLLGVDQAAFSYVTIMAGHFGETAAAAQQLTTSINGLIFMSIIGLGAATNIRVGHAVGAGDAPEAARAGWAGIGLCLLITSAVGALYLSIPSVLARLYTQQPDIVALAAVLISAQTLMLILDGVVTVTNGALRGRGDTMMPAIVHAASLWLTGVPLAFALAFWAGWGVVGLIIGLSGGMGLSCLILLARYRRLARGPVKRV